MKSRTRAVIRLIDLQGAVERTFSELIEEPWGRTEPPSWHPPVDIYESEDCYVLEADLPGVDPSDVELRVERNRLSICGTRTERNVVRTERRLWVERRSGRFCRKFQLDHQVNAHRVQTEYEHGIFRARLPKLEEGAQDERRSESS